MKKKSNNLIFNQFETNVIMRLWKAFCIIYSNKHQNYNKEQLKYNKLSFCLISPCMNYVDVLQYLLPIVSSVFRKKKMFLFFGNNFINFIFSCTVIISHIKQISHIFNISLENKNNIQIWFSK